MACSCQEKQKNQSRKSLVSARKLLTYILDRLEIMEDQTQNHGIRVNMNKWQQYEIEKKAIAAEAKSADEYEKRIKELAERLGV